MINAAPLRNADGELLGAVAGFQDITHQFEVNRLKDEFVSTVSHELRTPLTSIKGSLQLVLAEPESVPDAEYGSSDDRSHQYRATDSAHQ